MKHPKLIQKHLSKATAMSEAFMPIPGLPGTSGGHLATNEYAHVCECVYECVCECVFYVAT